MTATATPISTAKGRRAAAKAAHPATTVPDATVPSTGKRRTPPKGRPEPKRPTRAADPNRITKATTWKRMTLVREDVRGMALALNDNDWSAFADYYEQLMGDADLVAQYVAQERGE